MALMFDARVPVVFGTRSERRDGDFVVESDLGDGFSHDAGCRCCLQRTPAAETLGRLFLRRARGEVEFFSRVLVVGDAAAQLAVRAALQSDPVVVARFRLACGL